MALRTKRTRKSELLRQLQLDLLQLQGELGRHAEGMTAAVDQTPARWKVLTAAGCDIRTVPQIARRMGLSRQAVQRIANHLVEKGLARFVANPDHRASPILQLTERGAAIDDAICEEHARWSNRISRKLETKQLESAIVAIRALTRLMELEI